MNQPEPHYIAFQGHLCVAAGDLAAVAGAAKALIDADPAATPLILDADSRTVEVDFRGSPAEVLARLAAPAAEPAPAPEKGGRGRPKLGVVAREVTLLPRHWEWLAQQPGGASVALRKLVEEARRSQQPRDRARRSQEAVHRFLSVVAGDLPQYEEVLRAFYAGETATLWQLVAAWPADVANHLRRLLDTATVDAAAVETAATETADADTSGANTPA